MYMADLGRGRGCYVCHDLRNSIERIFFFFFFLGVGGGGGGGRRVHVDL